MILVFFYHQSQLHHMEDLTQNLSNLHVSNVPNQPNYYSVDDDLYDNPSNTLEYIEKPSEMNELTDNLNKMGMTDTPYTDVDYSKLENKELDNQIYIIQNSYDFSLEQIDEMSNGPNWHILQYHFAERVGYLGDKYLLDTINRMYILSLDSDLIESTLIGGSKGGHVHVMQFAMLYEDINVNLNREDIICNVFQSSIDEAIEYILEYSTNYSFILFLIKNSGKLDFYNDKQLISNVLRFGSETDKDELMKKVTDINSLLYGLGASGDITRIDNLIYTCDGDITMPLKGACKYGKINVIQYYYEEIGIGHTIPSTPLITILLENEQFMALEYLIEQGVELLSILNFQVTGFDYDRLLPVLNDFIIKRDFPQ